MEFSTITFKFLTTLGSIYGLIRIRDVNPPRPKISALETERTKEEEEEEAMGWNFSPLSFSM